MKTIYLLAAAASCLPTAAMAEDASAFGGLYVGALVGYDHVRVSDGTDHESADGVTYGAVVGYDTNLGGGVVGIEAEVADSSTDKSYTSVFATGDALQIGMGRDLYIGVRSGVRLSPGSLLYVKGGYINTRGTISYNDGAGTVLAGSDDLDGYRAGVGAEVSFGRISARAEYRYSDYGNFEIGGFDTGVDAQRHQFVATLLTRF